MHYISSRAIMALLTSFVSSLLLGKLFTTRFKTILACPVREYVPESHSLKRNKPSMGGIFILLATFCNLLLWADLMCSEVWILLACLLGFGAIGICDDWSKITRRKGIKSYTKFLLQCFVACVIICAWLWFAQGSTFLSIPFCKHFSPDIGLFFIPWAVFVIVAMSNAVNLTDGLDGLAISSLIPNFIVFSLICYGIGDTALGEVAVVSTVLIGASLGFLWYNTYPAEIFMGDVGSLSLGAGLACMALMCKQELLLLIAGAVFVLEVLSVILQVFSFKLRKKRLFLMAPIHHHFELSGWKENKITVRFSIISGLLCLVTLIVFALY